MWEHVAPVLAPVITAAGGIAATALAYRYKMRKQESEGENAHLTTFYDTMNSALREQEKRHSDSINQIREEQREERKQWAAERIALNEKIERLQELRAQDAKAIHSKEIEVVELRGEVKVLTERLNSSNTSLHPAEVQVKLK